MSHLRLNLSIHSLTRCSKGYVSPPNRKFNSLLPNCRPSTRNSKSRHRILAVVKRTAFGTMLLLIATCTASMSHSSPLSTAFLDCDDVKAGQTQLRKTAPIAFQSGSIRLYGSVRLSRAKGEAGTHQCLANYRLFLSSGSATFSMIKEFSDREDADVGVDIIGASNDGNMIAANFWWAQGDATGHRPVIVDVKANSAMLLPLDDRILKQLPSCDYFEEFIGVTDAGEAIIRVPKSAYVEKGRPSQGKWLFDLHSGKVKRMR